MSPLLAATPSASDVPLWASLVVGIGIGTIVSSLVTVLGQGWQRRHELNLEEIRDLQRLRDGRLERLREDLREVMAAAFDLQEAVFFLRTRAAPEPEEELRIQHANNKFTSSIERFAAVRARLVLDPDAKAIVQALTDLGSGVEQLQDILYSYNQMRELPPVHGAAEMAKVFREHQQVVAARLPPVIEQAQQLLQQVEQQPLYRRPGWWSRLRRKDAVQRLSQ
jgi:hypothetical protein